MKGKTVRRYKITICRQHLPCEHGITFAKGFTVPSAIEACRSPLLSPDSDYRPIASVRSSFVHHSHSKRIQAFASKQQVFSFLISNHQYPLIPIFHTQLLRKNDMSFFARKRSTLFHSQMQPLTPDKPPSTVYPALCLGFYRTYISHPYRTIFPPRGHRHRLLLSDGIQSLQATLSYSIVRTWTRDTKSNRRCRSPH